MTHPPLPQPDASQPKAKHLGISTLQWALLILLLTLILVGWRTLAQGQAQPLAVPRPTESSTESSEVAVSRPEIVRGEAATVAVTNTVTNTVANKVTSSVSDTDTSTVALTNPLTNPVANIVTNTVSITVTDGMVTTSSSAPTSIVSETAVVTNPLLYTTNILLLGSDRRPKDVNWRTDVIMIVALDMERGEAGVISIPRDLYIDAIENHQPNKINVVDYLGEQDNPGGGGPALLADILAQRIGVPIHHYLRFEFEGFKRVVDALGGVEIQIDCPVYDFLNEENIAINLAPGTHRLSGSQALSYVRTRRQGGDLERARRQQRIALAVRDQMLNENLLPRIPSLYVALQDAVDTDIGLVDTIRFIRFALQLTEEEVHGMILSPPDAMTSGWRRGMSVFVPNWPVITETIQTVFDRPPLTETNTVGPEGDVQRCR